MCNFIYSLLLQPFGEGSAVTLLMWGWAVAMRGRCNPRRASRLVEYAAQSKRRFSTDRLDPSRSDVKGGAFAPNRFGTPPFAWQIVIKLSPITNPNRNECAPRYRKNEWDVSLIKAPVLCWMSLTGPIIRLKHTRRVCESPRNLLCHS